MTDSALHTTEQSIPKIAIIGGGLTGLFTATLLERAFTQDNANFIAWLFTSASNHF